MNLKGKEAWENCQGTHDPVGQNTHMNDSWKQGKFQGHSKSDRKELHIGITWNEESCGCGKDATARSSTTAVTRRRSMRCMPSGAKEKNCCYSLSFCMTALCGADVKEECEKFDSPPMFASATEKCWNTPLRSICIRLMSVILSCSCRIYALYRCSRAPLIYRVLSVCKMKQ